MRSRLCLCILAAAAAPAFGRPTINGSISGSEGWTLLTEANYARPQTGGAAGSSDAAGESSSYNWYDGLAGSNVVFGDNRADVINVYAAFDATNLYVAVAGPTVPFNSFADVGGPSDGDQGDLYVAIDASGGSAAGSVRASHTHAGFNGGVRGVDFNGWGPSFFLGVQYVDNGGGGGGLATLEAATNHTVVASESQNQNNGAFDWHGAINASASYDTANGNAGEFEFAIPWTMLGVTSGLSPGYRVRLAAYTTQNYTNFDAYDCAPGLGNGTSYEAIGDNPGDPDSSGQLGPTDSGSFGQPGSDYTGDINFTPGHDDGIDTVEEYLQWTVIPDVPAGLGIVYAGANFQTTWSAGSGFVYRLQSSTNLLQQVWTNWGNDTTSFSSTVSLPDTNSATVPFVRFYRAVMLY